MDKELRDKIRSVYKCDGFRCLLNEYLREGAKKKRFYYTHSNRISDGFYREDGTPIFFEYVDINYKAEPVELEPLQTYSKSTLNHLTSEDVTRLLGSRLPSRVFEIVVLFLLTYGAPGFRKALDATIEKCSTPPPDEDQYKRAPQEQDTVLSSPEAPQTAAMPSDAASNLSHSLQGFLDRANRLLVFPPFSLEVLSLHFTFAAFYSFVAFAVTWGISGISDIGTIEILPDIQSSTSANRPDFNQDAVVEIRFFVLSLVMIVVMIFAIGLIAGATTGKVFSVSRALDKLGAHYRMIAVGSACASGIMFWASGMHWAFSVLFAASMTCSIILAGSLPRRTIIWMIYPLSFVANIALIVFLGWWLGSIPAAGGVLPVLSFLTLFIGAAAQSVRGALISSAMTVLCCTVLAAINFSIFDGVWFRIDPWDPGTVLILLLIPLANGFCDWVSTSTTRTFTGWALIASDKQDPGTALWVYVAFVLLDIVIAFFTVFALYFALHLLLSLYTAVAFAGTAEFASLDAYFRSFQDGLMTERGLLIIIMILTLFLPTILHVHLVGKVMIRGPAYQMILKGLAHSLAVVGAVILLLNAVRGALHFLVPM